MEDLEFDGTVDSFVNGVFTIVVAGRENVSGGFSSGCKVPWLEKGVKIRVRGQWAAKAHATDADWFGTTGYTIKG